MPVIFDNKKEYKRKYGERKIINQMYLYTYM